MDGKGIRTAIPGQRNRRPTPPYLSTALESRLYVGRRLLRLHRLHALGHRGRGPADRVRHVKVLQDLQAHVDFLAGSDLE